MSRTIGLEPHLMFTGGRTAAHVRGTGSPCGVDDDLVANQPCLAVLDGRRAADEPVPIVAGLQEDHFEAVPSGDVAPRGAEREWTEGGHSLSQSTRLPPGPATGFGSRHARLRRRAGPRVVAGLRRPDRGCPQPRGERDRSVNPRALLAREFVGAGVGHEYETSETDGSTDRRARGGDASCNALLLV
jgi:hypothetical protein